MIVAAAPRPRRAPVARPGRLERAKACALELAREGGYDGVTMARVAEASGVSRASLYQHFESKDHLLAAAWGDIAADYIPTPSGRALTGETPAQRVMAYLQACVRKGLREPTFVEAYMRAWSHAPQGVVDEFPSVFEQRIEQAIGDDLDPTRRNEVARVLEYVFSTVLLAMVSREGVAPRMQQELAMAVRLLLGD